MTEPKRYNVAEALAMAALSDNPERSLRDGLAMTTDIPTEKIDEAMAELVQAIPAVQAMGVLMMMARGGQVPTMVEMAKALTDSTWCDDDKKEGRYGVTVYDEEGAEIASAKVVTKLD